MQLFCAFFLPLISMLNYLSLTSSFLPNTDTRVLSVLTFYPRPRLSAFPKIHTRKSHKNCFVVGKDRLQLRFLIFSLFMSYAAFSLSEGFSGVPWGQIINASLCGRSVGWADVLPNYVEEKNQKKNKSQLINNEWIIDHVWTRGNEKWGWTPPPHSKSLLSYYWASRFEESRSKQ